MSLRSDLDRQLAVQNAAPAAADTVAADGSEFLLLQPAATIASATITLPAGQYSGHEIRVFTTAAVTSLTVSSAATGGVLGMPTSLAANGYFTAKFSADLNKWVRVA